MRARHSGFTLIELMMVVAILGILSSVAIPVFRKVQLRSKQAERALMITAIERATDDYYLRDSRYPTVAGADSSLLATYNPSYPPSSRKRPFDETQVGWRDLSLKVEGNVFYSYYVTATAPAAGVRDMLVYAFGDLDGDGINPCYAYHRRRWSGLVALDQLFYDVALVPGATYGCY